MCRNAAYASLLLHQALAWHLLNFYFTNNEEGERSKTISRFYSNDSDDRLLKRIVEMRKNYNNNNKKLKIKN